MKYVFLFFMAFLTTCMEDDNGIICTEQFVYGLNVTVKNADTNAIITEGVTVTAREGDYEEELMNTLGSVSFVGAGERAGNYIIEITSNDYQSYTSEVIVVDEDECHVIPQSLEALLQAN
ncbi:MAG: hypothetical protein DRI75_06435 [Bacteroidetes bacterium]|nr:MAG: hypothetical protein DRI75_06435 [Bacteroidota bacterium]